MKLLTDEFVNSYPNEPEHMTNLGKFVFYRTYSRWLESKGRRETFKEAIRRAVEYNVGLSIKKIQDNGFEVPFDDIQNEAKLLFDNVFNLRQFLSGRTHWVGGADTKIADKFPLSNFNCFRRDTEFLTKEGIKSFEDFNHGDIAEVLNSNGAWSKATVRNYGKQQLVRLNVQRQGTKYNEDIYTTAEHLWFVDKYNDGHFTKTNTISLNKGDILRKKKRYENQSLNMCEVAIQHGIVFGDGTFDKKKGHCRVSLMGEKQELLKYFHSTPTSKEGDRDSTLVYGLPYYFKELPTTKANVEYLKGFIYGLLLTDGRVGSSVRLGQKELEVVCRLQDMCEIIGLTTSKVTEVIRNNNNFGDYENVHEFTIHKEELEKHGLLVSGVEKRNWVVREVEIMDIEEEVWCVEEPITNSFTLRGGIHTHNCAFTEINEWEDLSELFYLLLIGTGVGLSSSKEMARNMKPIRRNYTLSHSEYNPVAPEERLEDTKLVCMDNGYAKLYIGDSKEAWTQALRLFFELITEPEWDDIHNIKISYNSIRPRGERLKTFGGTASGHETVRDMFIGIDKVLKDELDKTIEPMKEVEGKYYVRPIHILDIANLIGNNVVAGGVRRTAEIFLCDEDDWEVILAKYGVGGVWDEKAHKALGEKLYALGVLPSWWDDKELRDSKMNLTHRYMSNNSIAFENKPSDEFLSVIFDMIETNGEPGFINKEEMRRRRPNAKGINPCAEILLDSKQTCNLTTINMMSFIVDRENPRVDIPSLLHAQALSVRAGMRMTLLDLELKEWDVKHKRDRLVGTSITGWKDMVDATKLTIEQQNGLLSMLKEVAFNESLKYANSLRIANPLLITTVKPEGTLSQVAGGVSSGLHVSHSPYYIRRIRINATDPLAEVAKNYNWSISAEVGTMVDGQPVQDKGILKLQSTIDVANTLVIDFPIKSPAITTRENQTLKEQFDTYFQFQEFYTQHNSSNTITVRENEWEEAQRIILDGWDSFVGVSFIPYSGGTFALMPYEEITEEEYNELSKCFDEFSVDDLYKVEDMYVSAELDEDCLDGG